MGRYVIETMVYFLIVYPPISLCFIILYTMSDFGDFTTPDDPTADFLARERAALGDEADLFSNDISSPVNNTIPGLNSLPNTPSIFDVQSPAMNNHEPVAHQSTPARSSSFDQQFPKTEDLESSKAFHQALLPDEEPEVVRQWKLKHDETIKERDSHATAAKEEILNKARAEIDQFYEDYNEKKQKAIEENREHELQLQKSLGEDTSDNVWGRVHSLINSTHLKADYHSKDVGRMKDLILDLKKDTKAPGNIVHV
ncbi:clathrin light chain [Pilobolus umbonatus]|nr:clathrin light chain [Pilobolus umbonatus]